MQSSINIQHAVLTGLQELSPQKQQEVLDFVEFLKTKTAPKQPRKSLKGLWADLQIDLTEAEISEARREIWADFPKDIEV